MKFELEPYHRNKSDEDLLEDLRKTAKFLGKQTLTKSGYKKHGTYHPSTLHRRFGSWSEALSRAGLSKTRNWNIPANECLLDLQEVARKLDKRSVTIVEYKKHGHYSPAPFIRHFGSWFGALEKAGLQRTRQLGVTDEEYFQNIERLWRSLGRQPYYSDVHKPFSKYSNSAYEHRFGSWRKALEAFVNFVNKESRELGSVTDRMSQADIGQMDKYDSTGDANIIKHKTPRKPSWRLRFLVMRRDSFRCQNCGRSPASELGVVLHIDHNTPWSKGGETEINNLRTLCQRCNLGKGNLTNMSASD